jgi:hypothetical protein
MPAQSWGWFLLARLLLAWLLLARLLLARLLLARLLLARRSPAGVWLSSPRTRWQRARPPQQGLQTG